MTALTPSLSVLVYGRAKAGKALDVETPILTDSGWKMMKEIEVGDHVHAMDGSLVPVIAVSETLYDRDCYRVSFSDGSSLIADASHEWTVRDTMRAQKVSEYRVLTTTDMLDTYRMDSGRVAVVGGVEYPVVRHRYAIDRNIVLNRPDADLSVDPWVLGYWLGDGTTDQGQITVGQDDVPHFIDVLATTDCTVFSDRESSGGARTITIRTPGGPLQTMLRSLGVLGDKHIPDMYLFSSESQRMALLQGLMDSDGYGSTDHSGSSCEITMTNERLIRDVLFLVRSLGYKASIAESRATLDGRDVGPRWRVVFAAYRDRSPFRYERKMRGLKPHAASRMDDSDYINPFVQSRSRSRATTAHVTAIELVDSRPVRCIMVDHPSHTYLAGTDLVMTHNSTFAATAPYPRLMLDVEGGSRFLPIKTVSWDPRTGAPPKADGTWDTCVVVTRSYDDMVQTYQWLQSGKHQFASLIIDSVSELQVKLIEQISGREQMQMQAWGTLLRQFTGLLRDLRDLTMHATNPLKAVVLVAMEKETHDGQIVPYLQGQSAVTLPYITDITGYLRVDTVQNPDPTMPPYKVRRLYISPDDRYIAGERVGGRLGDVIEQQDLSIEMMIERVYGAPVADTVKEEE